MNSKELFLEAVRLQADLPPALQEHVANVQHLQDHRFDQSYIDFLDEQIRLNPRGPEWTERLKQRRAALVPHCGALLISGRVVTPKSDFTVEVDPKSNSVI